ncbi:Crp/Fnr family transcriptional regulator [Sphingomonas segetis]|uniref:Crp/Fnr family transcriptional regulator n=1 Tax=Sphingomonas segetis TaxID=1104779 RepID=UPI0012D3642C|nr:Crp/Fnr family transcriptional regulator [Sphingomonas segetis]
MITAHLHKLRQRTHVSADEEQAIRNSVAETRSVPAGRVMVRCGEPLSHSVMLLEGWMARVKDLEGGARQVTELHLPGDFVDLHGFTLKRLDHDVVALTDSTVGLVPHGRLREITERLPRLGRIYWFMTNVDAAITRELVLSLGQRSAISRMAHLFCEICRRLEIVGRGTEHGCDFPLTQRELSECLGLTVVHVNRTLQELRRRALVELENRQLTIRDRAGLEALAEFDPAYLYLDQHRL